MGNPRSCRCLNFHGRSIQPQAGMPPSQTNLNFTCMESGLVVRLVRLNRRKRPKHPTSWEGTADKPTSTSVDAPRVP
jgi:hypothetical protein